MLALGGVHCMANPTLSLRTHFKGDPARAWLEVRELDKLGEILLAASPLLKDGIMYARFECDRVELREQLDGGAGNTVSVAELVVFMSLSTKKATLDYALFDEAEAFSKDILVANTTFDYLKAKVTEATEIVVHLAVSRHRSTR